MTCVRKTERIHSVRSTPRWMLALGLLVVGAGTAQAAGLTVAEALERAMTHDTAYAAAFANQRADREVGVQGRATLKPSVSLRGSAGYIASDSSFAFGQEQDEYPAYSAGIEARQPVLRMDWSARRERADANDMLADERLRGAQIEFVGRLAQRYLAALQAQDQLRLTETEVAAVEKALTDVRQRYEVELVAGTDLKEAQARFDLTRAQLIRAQAGVEETRDALAELTGTFDSPLPSLKPTLQLSLLPTASMDDWMARLNEHNPALRIARLNLDVAQADRKARKAEVLPSADLVASANNNDSSKSDLGTRQKEARIELQVSVPIYAGGALRSRVREAQARMDALVLAREQTQREAERELRTQYRNYQTSVVSVEALTVGLESARAAEEAVAVGYDVGTRTITDVLDARRRVAQAELDLNQSRYGLLTDLLLLQAAAGTLGPQDAQRLDSLLEMPAAQP